MDVQNVEIQIQTSQGHWQTVRSAPYVNNQYVNRQLEIAKSQHPKASVRAIDSETGALVNLLP